MKIIQHCWLWSVLTSAVLTAQTVTEPFSGSTAPGWVFNGVGYTPNLTSGVSDPVNDGWLRLTSSSTNQATSAYYDTAVSSANRTVFTSFDYASYNGTGADGITFFLFDGSATFSVGADGGSMGYAQKTGVNGLAGGYLAISLDDFGNFSNASEGRTGGIGFNPNAVAVRGPGSGTTGYDFIAATGDGTNAALTQQLDLPGSTTRPSQTGADYRHVEILITPTNQLTVWLQFGASGGLTKVLEADLSGYLRPETLKFGFTSGTGSSTEVHELRALTVATLVANLWDNGANGGSSATGDWGASANWNPDVPTTGDDILFDNTFVSTSQTVNVGTGATRTIRSVQIDAPFDYTLNNGTLNFDNVGLPGFLGIAVTQTNGVSSAGNTINSNITTAAAATIRNSTTSTLTLNGTISNGGNALTFEGSGNTTATGVISGTGSLVKSQAGNLTLSGNNTYSGGSSVSGGTVTIGHNNALGTGGVVLTGGELVGSGTRTIGNTVSLQGDAGITNLSLSNTLTQSGGDRTLTLSGTNGLGDIKLSESNTARTLTTNVTSGVTTVNGVIANGGTGAGGLTKTGAGTLNLSGNNTYTGITTISDGSIQLGANSRISDSSAVSLGGGTLDLNTFSEHVGNLSWTADSTLDFGAETGANVFLVNNITSASGVLTINNWTSGSDFFGSATGGITTPLDSIYFAGYAPGAVIAGSTTSNPGGFTGSFYEITPGASNDWYTWDSGNNSNRWDRGANWTHPTLDNTVPVTNAKVAFGTGAQTTVDTRSNRTINAMRFDPGSASFIINNNTITFSAASTTGIAVLQQQSSNLQTINSAVSLARNTVVDVSGSGTMLINGVISGSKNLVKEGTGGDLLLRGNNTLSGNVYINNGTLRAGSSTALGTGTTTVTSGATLSLAEANSSGTTTTGSLSIGNGITIAGSGAGGNGAIRNLANSNTLTGTVTLSDDARIQSDSGTLTLSNATAISASGKNISLGGAGNITISGIIATGTGALTKDDDGVVTLSGATSNTYTGMTTVNGGTLVLSKTPGTNIDAIRGNLVIGDGTGTDTVRLDQNNQIIDTATVTINNGGVFNVNGKTETIANLSSSSSGSQVQLGAGTLTVNNSTANTYAGTLTGSGGLTKTGAGRLTLSGSSGSYTGTTNVNSGIVALGSGTALGTGTVNVASGGNVEVQGGVTVANTFSIQGDGTGASDGAIENFSGNNTLSGNITLANNARIGSSSGTLTLSSAGTLSGTNRNLIFSGAGDTVVNRNINTGTGTLTKQGSGNLTLNTANAYTGATTIDAGKITAGTTGIFSDSAALTINNSAVYDMAGFSETIGSLQSSAGVGGSINFGGGTLTLAGGASSFGGDFGFTNGTIVINAGQSLTLTDSFNAANINIVLNGGSLFLGNGLNQTFGNLTVTASSVIDFGTSGATTAQFDNVNVTSGTLSVNNWTDAVDYFLVHNSPGPQGSSPTNKVVFAGYTGAATKWINYGGGNGQLSPVPEPSTYGAMLLGASAGLFVFRRTRRRARG